MRDRRIICAALIVIAVWITFGRTIGHEFAGGWDDGPLIVDNPLINPPTGEGLVNIWGRAHARMYIPVVYTTWWTLAHARVTDEATRGTTPNPYVFHAANVIVHTLSALIVFAILRLLVRRDWPAAAGALLFALHPLQVEPVAWATGMKDVLSGMLALAAMWQYLEFTTATDPPRRRIHYAVAMVAFILALLAKPSTVVVPFMLIVIEWLVLCRPIRRALLATLPWMLIAGGWMVVTANVQPTPEIFSPPIWQRELIAGNAVGFYLSKLIWPAKLTVDYGARPETFWRSGLIVVAIAVTAMIALARRRWLTASGLIFVIALLPVLGLKPFVFQWLSTVADRYTYLALVAPAMALAIALADARRPAVTRLGWWAVGAALVVLAIRSNLQSAVWADSPTLMRHALAINPASPAANNFVGDELFRDRDYSGAAAHFATAVRVKPQYLSARDNLVAALVRLQRYDETLALLKQTLEIRRSLPEPIRQPIDQDLARIRAVEQLIQERDRPAPYPAGGTQSRTPAR
jgi:hypothetical protein